MKKSLVILLFACLSFYFSFSQNMGIGILNPTKAKLEISGAVGNTVAIFGGDAHGISVQRGNPAVGFNQYYDGTNSRYIASGYAAVQWFDALNGNMNYDVFPNGTANSIGTPTRVMTIDNNGRVGIGVAPNANARLTVARGTGSEGTAVFRGSVYASYFNYSTPENTYIRGGKSGSYVYLNDVVGASTYFGSTANLVRVGINSGDPMYALEIKQVGGRGLILVASDFNNWHFNVGPTTAQGGYHRLHYYEAANPIGSFHPQTGAYAALSDVRFKKDIQPLERISEKIMQLQPVHYEMKEGHGSSGKKMGFIAQDVKKIFPELVHVDKDTLPGQRIPDMHLLNYDGLSVYVIQVIREQQATIDALKKRIENLKKLNHEKN
jgi:hypothetical protein